MKIRPETIASIKQIIDPEVVVDYLGFQIVRKTPGELRGPCKVHGGDNTTAFRMNLETKTWCCYTKHCEGEKHRDLIGLIQLTSGRSFVESVSLLASFCGVNLENEIEVDQEVRKFKQQQEIKKEIKNSVPQAPVVNFFDEAAEKKLLDRLRPHRSAYFEDRGFPAELLDFYEVGGMTDSYGVHRETIPIRDEDGNLLTISARRTDSDDDPKYTLLEDIPKAATLYNLHVARHHAGEDRTLILVEGFVDVWSLSMLGVFNVVAIMGTMVTPNQARLLWRNAENIVVMLDADDAGRKGTVKVVKLLERGARIRSIDLPDGKDPKDFKYTDLREYGIGELNEYV